MTSVQHGETRGRQNGFQTALGHLDKGHADAGQNGVDWHSDYALDMPFDAGCILHDGYRVHVENEGSYPACYLDAGQTIDMDTRGLARLQKDWLFGLSHSRIPAARGTKHAVRQNASCSAESCAAKTLSWLIAPNSFEQSLELMMEERDQFRAAVATSKSLNNFNRETISPVNSPIALTGGSSSPHWAATDLPPSVSSGAFIEFARHSLNARNLAGGFCQISVSHFSFISSPHRLGVVEQHQQSMRQMQNGYPATHKWYPGNDRVH